MVAAVRQGQSMRSVARDFDVGLNTVQRWVAYAGPARLDRVDWSDRRGGRRQGQATDARTEELIMDLRKELRASSDLGEFGAAAIHRELVQRQPKLRLETIPAIRTIGRIIERRGGLDGRRRVRRPAPPTGWYLPEVRERRAELDSFDIVEGLVIAGGHEVEVLNGISLHGGLTMSQVTNRCTAKKTVNSLLDHWRAFGVPDYAQFDNDTIFQGAHQWPDSFGRVTRLCLQLEIIPVFAPPRETGFQAAIEGYNGRWQSKVWNRFTHPSRSDLARRSDRYLAASHAKSASRIEAAPWRWEIPADWDLDLSRPLEGTVIFMRRTDGRGHIHLLGHDWEIDKRWPHRLVRCHVDLTDGWVHVYRLRRKTPTVQPLLKSLPYDVPTKRFKE